MLLTVSQGAGFVGRVKILEEQYAVCGREEWLRRGVRCLKCGDGGILADGDSRSDCRAVAHELEGPWKGCATG